MKFNNLVWETISFLSISRFLVIYQTWIYTCFCAKLDSFFLWTTNLMDWNALKCCQVCIHDYGLDAALILLCYNDLITNKAYHASLLRFYSNPLSGISLHYLVLYSIGIWEIWPKRGPTQYFRSRRHNVTATLRFRIRRKFWKPLQGFLLQNV